MEKPTSAEIRKLYKKSSLDEHIFELTDLPGLQIVRKYPPLDKFGEKRMFIKFFLTQEGSHWYANGGVDMVQEQKEPGMSGWTIQYPQGLLFQRPTNYSFYKSEEILFDTAKEVVLFKGRSFQIGEFINLLQKNHMRDMFFVSRLWNAIKTGFLYIIFFLSDAKYVKFKYLFFYEKNESSVKEELNLRPASESADPLFHYFHIYKNLFGLTILLLLYPLLKLSIMLTSSYFTVSNPFLLFSALFLLYALEKISDSLFFLLSKTNFVPYLTKSTLESKGHLKIYGSLTEIE